MTSETEAAITIIVYTAIAVCCVIFFLYLFFGD